MTFPVFNKMLTDYIRTLLDVATERVATERVATERVTTEQVATAPHWGNRSACPVPVQTAPVQFLTELFRYIAANRVPISRAGTDNLMDVLFETMDLPEDASQVTSALDLPTTPPAFQAYWTHIVLPAWEQLTTLKRVLAATAATETTEATGQSVE